MSKIHIYTAASLGEVLAIVNEIANLSENKNQPLWFKGMKKYKYMLLPSMYRKPLIYENRTNDKSYGYFNQFDEMHYMVFKTRAENYIKSSPHNMTEWMELLEYNAGHTRMIKFSESMNTGLNFALRPFLSQKNDPSEQRDRKSATPVLWVLNPARLNKKVYNYFQQKSSTDLISYALEEFYPEIPYYQNSKFLERERLANIIRDDLEKYQDFLFMGRNGFGEMEQVISLNVLNDLRNENAARMQQLLTNREFNPFYYLLLRFYQDAIPFRIYDREKILPPMATILPAFNDRMRAQHGAVVVAPNYVLSDSMTENKSITGIDYRAMDYQAYCHDCIYKIQLLQPDYIARELIMEGERITSLEPDLHHYVQVMENKTDILD